MLIIVIRRGKTFLWADLFERRTPQTAQQRIRHTVQMHAKFGSPTASQWIGGKFGTNTIFIIRQSVDTDYFRVLVRFPQAEHTHNQFVLIQFRFEMGPLTVKSLRIDFILFSVGNYVILHFGLNHKRTKNTQKFLVLYFVSKIRQKQQKNKKTKKIH